MTLALFMLIGVLISLYKGRFKSYMNSPHFLLIVVILAIVCIHVILERISPDGFADRIQSLSPDFYNIIGAPAVTWPKYEEEQRYNIGALGNAAVVSANDKEVLEGPFKKRLLSLMESAGK